MIKAMDGHTYVLDANVFIEAARRYYAFDLVPRFWTILVEQANNGLIESIDRVKQELNRGNDELADWANTDFANAFASTNRDEIIEWYRNIIAWVINQNQFYDSAKSEFAKGADGWLVAYAKYENRIIVTQEILKPGSRKSVPIPNVCRYFNVRYIDTFDMLRAIRVQI